MRLPYPRIFDLNSTHHHALKSVYGWWEEQVSGAPDVRDGESRRYPAKLHYGDVQNAPRRAASTSAWHSASAALMSALRARMKWRGSPVGA